MRSIFDAFRRWGYLEATLDPLGLFEPLKHADLDALTGEAAEEARRIYCGTVGADFMHLPEPNAAAGSRSASKRPRSEVDQHKILERLIRADPFRTGFAGALLGNQAILPGSVYRADSAA